MDLKVEVIRPRPFKWIRSRRRAVFDLYKELIRPVKFIARKRSPKLVFKK